MQYKTVSYNNIEVCYIEELDGGGTTFGQDYLYRLKQQFLPIHSIMEWCAGPGFIGFSLLAHGLCDRLYLADINPQAVAACQETINRNNLADRVKVYLSDCFDDIPSSETFDLIVGNPPHFHTEMVYEHLGPKILYMDPGWASHGKFYRQAGSHLTAGGNILLQEHSKFSSAETFRTMIEASGLQLIRTCTLQRPSTIYYIWSAKKATDRV